MMKKSMTKKGVGYKGGGKIKEKPMAYKKGGKVFKACATCPTPAKCKKMGKCLKKGK